MKFKIGDKVKIIQRKANNITGLEDYLKTNGDVGKIGIVTSYRYNKYRVEKENGRSYLGLFEEDDLQIMNNNVLNWKEKLYGKI